MGEDLDIFETTMADAGLDASTVLDRGRTGLANLSGLISKLAASQHAPEPNAAVRLTPRGAS